MLLLRIRATGLTTYYEESFHNVVDIAQYYTSFAEELHVIKVFLLVLNSPSAIATDKNLAHNSSLGMVWPVVRVLLSQEQMMLL